MEQQQEQNYEQERRSLLLMILILILLLPGTGSHRSHFTGLKPVMSCTPVRKVMV